MTPDLPKIDIVSDPICPWCYIGKAKLDEALATRPEHKFELKWRIFQLNPDMPAEGMGRRAYLQGKFGGPEGADQIYGKIEQAAIAAGLDIDFAKIDRTPNTLNAHRLIRWAVSSGRQHELVGSLFDAYFRQGKDIGDIPTLIELGMGVGLDEDLLKRLFAEDADRSVLMNEDALGRQMGISGVPCFILQEKFALVGAQEVDTWLNVFDRVERGQLVA